jgi:uncharacterized membrane protein
MRLNETGSGEFKLETIIGYLLITGVLISLCLELTGIILYYRSYGNLQILMEDKTLFITGNNFFHFLANAVTGEGAINRAVSFMRLGAAALMLTPYLMIIVSFFYFIRRKNLRYVLITGVVITIITVSLTLH